MSGLWEFALLFVVVLNLFAAIKYHYYSNCNHIHTFMEQQPQASAHLFTLNLQGSIKYFQCLPEAARQFSQSSNIWM